MKLWVGVTDNDWYRFLGQLPDADEVNFWQPGGIGHIVCRQLETEETRL